MNNRNFVIITGCAGFIGSNFANYYLKKVKKDIIIGVDKITYAGDIKKIQKLKKYKNFIFFKCDISNKKIISKILKKYNVSKIINFAAETHVDNSIKRPDVFIKTNINGTFNLLNLAYNYWKDKKNFNSKRFLQISTDEVYGSINKGSFSENSPFAPNSPYSSSKASADLIVKSFFKTYKLPVIITNSSNNFGPGQHSEKFIPTIIRSLINKKKIPIYGKGLNIRNWLFVEDNNDAIFQVLKFGRIGQNYNIGSQVELTNLELVKKICKIFSNIVKDKFNYLSLISFVTDRKGHDQRYSLNIKKIQKECKWRQKNSFEKSLKKTIIEYL